KPHGGAATRVFGGGGPGTAFRARRGGLLCLTAGAVHCDRQAGTRTRRHPDSSRAELRGSDAGGRTARRLGQAAARRARRGEGRAGISGTLRLGTGPTVSMTTALPVAAFCGLHPLAKVTICSRLSSTELLRQLRDFELDAAIAHFGPDDQSALEVVPLEQ